MSAQQRLQSLLHAPQLRLHGVLLLLNGAQPLVHLVAVRSELPHAALQVVQVHVGTAQLHIPVSNLGGLLVEAAPLLLHHALPGGKQVLEGEGFYGGLRLRALLRRDNGDGGEGSGGRGGRGSAKDRESKHCVKSSRAKAE